MKMLRTLSIVTILFLLASWPALALQTEVPTELPKWLEWVVTGGSAAVISALLAWSIGIPEFKRWWESRSPKAQQLITILCTNGLALVAVFVQFGLDYRQPPATVVSWVELIFGYLILPLFSGLTVRQVLVSNRISQKMFVRDRVGYRNALK